MEGRAVKLVGPTALVDIIYKHPWSSLRDGALLSTVMTLAVLIARRYDLFTFFTQLADPRHAISPAEAVVLAGLFVVCIYIFVTRRVSEERCDTAYQIRLECEMRELRELAMQDPLTKLANRRALLLAVEAATEVRPIGRRKHAFFLLDLNEFKRVNDLYGHAVGDHVLQVVVERFRRVARPSDILARLGGDEFALLSYNVDRGAAGAIGTRFVEALKTPISTDGHVHEIGVAIGAALFPDDGVTVESILRHADCAMYRAKEHRGSSLAFFDSQVDSQHVPREAIG